MTDIQYTWRVINPGSGDIPEEEGHTIANPYLVLKGVLRFSMSGGDPEQFLVFTPPVSGNLDHVIVVPDVSLPPAQAYDLEITQFYMDTYPNRSLAAQAVDGLDMLNGLGAALPVGVLTRLHVLPFPGVRSPILNELFVQDRLMLDFTGMGEGPQLFRIYVYLYFQQGGRMAINVI